MIRGLTPLKHCLMDDLILLSNLRKILPIQGNLRKTGHLPGANFGKDRRDFSTRKILLSVRQNAIYAFYLTKFDGVQLRVLLTAGSWTAYLCVWKKLSKTSF